MEVGLKIGAAPTTLGRSRRTGLVALAEVADITCSASERTGTAVIMVQGEIHAVVTTNRHAGIAG
jgi:hypothetical protein